MKKTMAVRERVWNNSPWFEREREKREKSAKMKFCRDEMEINIRWGQSSEGYKAARE